MLCKTRDIAEVQALVDLQGRRHKTRERKRKDKKKDKQKQEKSQAKEET